MYQHNNAFIMSASSNSDTGIHIHTQEHDTTALYWTHWHTHYYYMLRGRHQCRRQTTQITQTDTSIYNKQHVLASQQQINSVCTTVSYIHEMSRCFMRRIINFIITILLNVADNG